MTFENTAGTMKLKILKKEGRETSLLVQLTKGINSYLLKCAIYTITPFFTPFDTASVITYNRL